MSDDRKARRPFGERDDDERQRPFGAPPGPAELPSQPDSAAREEAEAAPSTAPRYTYGSYGAPSRSRAMESAYQGLREPDDEAEPEPEAEPELYFEPDFGDDDAPREIAAAAPARARRHRRTEDYPAIRPSLVFRTMGSVLLLAAVIASVLTWWTPNAFLPSTSMDQLSVALATQSSMVVPPPPTATPEPTPLVSPTPAPPPRQRIGVVAGHRGPHPSTGLPDPGSICSDGLTEAEINLSIAEYVVDWLGQHGYEVELLDEFDARLAGYEADALISIHADSCDYVNDIATGFKVASFSESSTPVEDQRLVQCLSNRYATTTGLPLHQSVTFDMTQYHSFREVGAGTPGAIIEVGFLYLDRDFLTGSPDVAALGIARGVLCYLRDEPVDGPANPPTAGVSVEQPAGEAPVEQPAEPPVP